MKDSEQVLLVALLAGVALLAFALADFFGVPFLQGVAILPSLIAWAVAVGVVVYIGYIEFLWPVALSWLWLCFRPILDFKAGVRDDDLFVNPYMPWYGSHTNQLLVAALILAVGYGVRYWRNSRY